MEGYKKHNTISHKEINPFADVLSNETRTVVEVRFSSHSIFGKVLGFATRKLRHPDTGMLLLIAQDEAEQKAEKCTEILHNKFPGLHQCNAVGERVFEDIWIPKNEELGLDILSVKQHIPVAFTLLAKNNLPEKLRTHPQRMRIKASKSFNTDSRNKEI